MVDKVKPLKIENASLGGTQNDPFPTETNPTQDYIAAKGFAIENLDTYLVDKSGSNMQFTDPTAGARTLNQLRTASQNSFDNTSNGFTATNVQTAIEEARNTATGLLMYTVSVTCNGSMSNGQWIGKGELLSNTVTYVAPRSLQLIGASWGNSNANVDFDLEFFKNGRGTTKFRTFQIRNLTYGYEFNWSDSFVAGDFLDIKYVDQGDNASDFAIDLIFKAV
jgi:hypothetical protein